MKSYLQSIVMRGRWLQIAQSWEGAGKLKVIHVPITEKGASAVIGIGQYCEPFLLNEGDKTPSVGFCLTECAAAEKEKDLFPLVQFILARGGV